ncbi:MAG: diguanylate cyclase/phosphodiesterase [Candidatus Brocadia sinica]|nr:MAG: diguanylate cyclase/phosphodiesterase [Candidatus Brocadia sinica]
MGVVADITEHKRTLAIDALFHEIDQLVLQGQTLDFILPYVCTRLVDIFAYPLIWIGMKEPDGAVSISAKAGTHTNYLHGLKVRWDNTSDGQCTIGLSVRSKKTQTSSNTQEPAIRRCLEWASRYGFQSFAAVPLLVNDKILGVLNLYALEPNAFDTETIRMLENLAARISVTLLIAMDQQQLRLQGIAMESVANAVFITDCDGRIKWVNNAFTILSGYTEGEVSGKTPRLFKSGKQDPSFYQQVWQTILAGKVWRGEIINRRKDGDLYTVNQTITPLLDTHGKVCHFVAIHEDISDKKKIEERIHYMAHYDALTNLPNRNLFLDYLELELAHAHRNERMVAVMFLDLDRFKIINDTMGHAFGDQLLRAVAERLRACVREGDTVSRLGGDEFTFIIPDIANSQDTVLIAQKILNAMSRSFQVEGHEVHVTPSIGIALYPSDADDAGSLIKKADTAMYHAKEHGKNTFQFYRDDMNVSNFERLTLENGLRKALEKGELLVYYQPLIDQNTGQIISMEALARWQHPDLGMIYPTKFIPIAEETGLIVPIGEWVLMKACAQTRTWHDAGFHALRVMVNLSARQFKQQNLVNTITQVLQKTGLDPHYLELELTEGIVMQNDITILSALRELKALGILLSIDDFGTQYSSLSYLKRFPIDTLKIDRSFVHDITTNPDDAAIVTAIIAIAESLKLKVVAEGVENKEQAAFLRKLRCNNIQGYVYSHPLPARAIEHLLQKGAV